MTIDSSGPSFTSDDHRRLRVVTTVQPWLTVQGLASEQVYYTTSDNPYGGFGITVAPIEPLLARGGLGMDRQTALRFLLDHDDPFTVDGHRLWQETGSIRAATPWPHGPQATTS